MIINIFLFIISFVMLGIAAHWIVNSLTFLARFFKWREFVLVYFVLVIGASIPNFAVGIFSSLQGAPDLFFGDVIGNSLITLTLIVGLAAFVNKGLRADSRVVQQSSVFVILTSLLPLLLIMDGRLSRGDGIVLLAIFFFYSSWLFSKRKLFEHTYDEEEGEIKKPVSSFFKSVLGIIMGLPFLILAGKWIVDSSLFFAQTFGFQLAIFGVLIVAIGTSLPELFFIVTAAKKKNNWLALGGIIGDVIVLPTLGLGIIAVISPIEITAFSAFLPLFIFLITASCIFVWIIKSDKKITCIEAVPLLFVYGAFLLYEIFSRIF
ncbi:MAG: sodium:calcium antiporter [Candidatus Pacebacteria bacterium]|nr:sodium:calcium antiporter [Candidatus Paceibacterota bacterium]